jgi:hypothetical protein
VAGTSLLTSSLFLALDHSFLELVDASAGINQLLTSSKERVAFRTDIHVHIALDRTGLESFAAGTLDIGFDVLGMNALFHCFTSHRKMRRGSSLLPRPVCRTRFAVAFKCYTASRILSTAVTILCLSLSLGTCTIAAHGLEYIFVIE